MSEEETNRPITKEDLRIMQAVELGSVPRKDLVDIKDVVIDRNASEYDRLQSFCRQIKNPYLFRCGTFVVKIGPGGTGDFQEALARGIVLS